MGPSSTIRAAKFLLVACSLLLATIRSDESPFDLDQDPTWEKHEVWVSNLPPPKSSSHPHSSEDGTTGPNLDYYNGYYLLRFDPHFESVADCVRNFCSNHGGCDGFTKLALRQELLNRLRQGAVEARIQLTNYLIDVTRPTVESDFIDIGASPTTMAKASWFSVADPRVLERRASRAPDVRAILLEGRLPLPSGDCVRPSELLQSIGACPLNHAQEVLRRAAGLDSSESETAESTHIPLWPTDGTGWALVAARWFEAEEMALAAAAYLHLLAHVPDPSKVESFPSTRGSSQNSTINIESHEAELTLSTKTYVAVEHGLGVVATTWGFLKSAEQLLLGATAHAEDPQLLFDDPSEYHHHINSTRNSVSVAAFNGIPGLSVPVLPLYRGGCTPALSAALRFKAALLFPPVAPKPPQLGRSRARLLAAAKRLASLPHAASSTLNGSSSTSSSANDAGNHDEAPRLPIGGAVVAPSDELGLTFFHLAHQGRNNAALMRAIGQALRNVAPSLAYVAPHLRLGELRYGIPPGSPAASGAYAEMSSAPPIESAMDTDVGKGFKVTGAQAVTAAMKAMQAFDQRPLKLGVCSNHLGDHSIGRMLAMLLKDMASLPLHSDGRGNEGSTLPLVKIWILDQTPSKPSKVDHVRQFILEHAAIYGGHVFLPSFSLPKDGDGGLDNSHNDVLSLVQKKVASLELDVLLYPDVGMEPLTFLLSFARLAPIQAVWWGHPDTTASLALDVFVGLDDEISSAADDQYLEQLTRMTWLNTAPFAVDYAPERIDGGDGNEEGGTGESEFEHRDSPFTFGLGLLPPPTNSLEFVNEQAMSQQPHIFLVLGRLFKLHPDFDSIMLEILRRDLLAVIVLIQERHEPWTSAVWERLQASAIATDAAEATATSDGPSNGDATQNAHTLLQERPTATAALGRVRFLHYWNYIRVLRLPQTLAVLDTWPYGGCLTALEALSNGRPVMTLPSAYARGRFALSMYRLMGLAENDGGSRGDENRTIRRDDRYVTGDACHGTESSPRGLVASTPGNLVSAVACVGTDDLHRKRLVDSVRAKYPTLSQHNGDAALEWAQHFRGLYRQATAVAAQTRDASLGLV